MAKERWRIVVSGLVQGVGFRFFAVRVAQMHGVAGWVRNTADGRVEIEAEGETDALQKFLLDVKQGPRMAEINHAKVERSSQLSGYRSFEIR